MAAVAQLVSAPWPLWVRISVFVGLLLAGLFLITYQAGVRHGERTLDAPGIVSATEHSATLATGWTSEDLAGRQFVKVASSGSIVTICALHEDGSLVERLLPLSANDAHEFQDTWSGSWFLHDNSLYLLVAGRHLVLQSSLKGTWTGIERFGYDEHLFIGAVIEPKAIPAGRAWVGLRLMSGNGERHLVSASSDGSLQETDLYERSKVREGAWRTDTRGVHLETDGAHWFAESLGRGILMAVDQHHDGFREFALVRVRVLS